VHHLDERLARSQALGNFHADGAGTHGIGEGLDHRERDIGLQQCKAHLAHRVGDVVLADVAASAQALQGTRQSFGQLVKHGSSIISS